MAKNRTVFTLDSANRVLPLVQAIANELGERRGMRHSLARTRDALESARTPEGLQISLSNLDARVFEQDAAIDRCLRELAGLGVEVFRVSPLTIHFYAESRNREVVFCWQEGEPLICHGHAEGEESEPRRPLKVRASNSDHARPQE